MSLTVLLQESFALGAPPGWQCSREVSFLSKDLEARLGFAPRADVLLENHALGRRLWIEFEISRADPVANHMKFAVGHLFFPQPAGDAFISMVSHHVAVGRRNLGATAVILMRRLGMQAFQVPLLPAISGAEIKLLNHLTKSRLMERNLSVAAEIERAITIAEPVFVHRANAIFFASNALEVSLNVASWNRDAATEMGAALWGKRTVTFFVYDPRSYLFAPSKFCAFLPALRIADCRVPDSLDNLIGMTIEYYCSVDQTAPLFDGAIARRHLLDRLGYRLVEPGKDPDLQVRFNKWLVAHEQLVRVHPRSAHIMLPE
jgi:hypothetical protein